MRLVSKTGLLVALVALFLVPSAFAQSSGSCNLGSAQKDLDGNNVRARLYNNGALFWKGSGNVYTVPKNGEANAIFASGIWIGGLDSNDELRFAGTAYGPFEYWPGPLDANGNPPADCSVYDRIYKVTASDMANYEATGTATADMTDWAWELGAPVNDGDGNPNNYDLAAGDRPGLIGEQTAWWIMNDVGNVKEWSQTAPIGLQVAVTAFAFNTSDALNNTTFYKYTLTHKGAEVLRDTYFGIWSDPDLGNAADDYVGSDPTLGLGFVYNGEDVDQGADGYGIPPALAYDFFQGPLVPDEDGGTHVDPDGTTYPGMKRIAMTKFVYYNNDSTPFGNPTGTSDDPYNYLRGIWRDGLPMTFGGNGYGGTEPTNFIFPGDPVKKEFWSEENTDGAGSRNTPADRRFLMSSGPFTMNPGDVQDITYGIVWSQSVNRLASVAQMKFDDILAQGAFDSNFNIPPPPSKPQVSVEAIDKGVIIEWTNAPASSNFLNGYDDTSAFLVDKNPPDGNTTYTFEGYEIIQYTSAFDQTGSVIATYDVNNGVQNIVDEKLDIITGAVITAVVATGTDRGVQNFHVIENLVNFQEYHFGIKAYAYNPHSSPKVYASPIERLTVIPAPLTNRNGGTVLAPGVAAGSSVVRSALQAGSGDPGGVFATVVNPAGLTGDSYSVSVYDAIPLIQNVNVSDGHGGTLPGYVLNGDSLTSILTYDIRNATTGQQIIRGVDFLTANDKNVPFGRELFTTDGLSFSVSTADPNFGAMEAVANGAGVLDPPEGATADYNGFPSLRPGSRQQVGEGAWMIHTGGNGSRQSYDAFLARSIRNGWDPVVPFDFEVRFTQSCYDAWATAMTSGDPYGSFPADACYGYDRFSVVGGGDTPTIIPFEIWNIGIATPDDTSDDYQLVPANIDWDGDGYNLQCFDHETSSADNDPESDWTYWYEPVDSTPGSSGYEAWKADLLSGATPYTHGGEIMARYVWVNWNGGDVANCAAGRDVINAPAFDQEMPEAGTVFRLTTLKPLAAGDVMAIDTSPFAPTTGTLASATDQQKEEQLDLIGIVPNPYKGASAYEVDLTQDKVRFTNLPEQATIRIFTLAGTLIRTFVKNSASPTLQWNLETGEGLPIASGMYLIHVDVPGVGEKVLKFGVVKKRVQLDLF